MANEQNLIPQAHKLTVEEMSRGGKNCAEMKRQRKAMKKQLELLLSLPVNKDNEKILKKLKIDNENLDNQMLMLVGLWQSAINGNTQAFDRIQNLVDDKVNEEKDNSFIEALKGKTEEVWNEETE